MMMITITGPDASGKDTQIEKLTSHLKAKGYRVQNLSIQNSIADFTEISDMKTINSFLGVFLGRFSSQARSHFLLSLLHNAFAKTDSSCDFVIWNSFWYKYAASEITYGVSAEFWKQQSLSFTKPDLTLILNAKLENCLLRRSQWSKYESGLGHKGRTLESFQTEMRKNLDIILEQQMGEKKYVDADNNEDLVASEIINTVENSLLKK